MSLLRTQGQALLPYNFRVYDKPTRTGTFARCHKKQIAALSWHFHRKGVHLKGWCFRRSQEMGTCAAG